MDLIGALNERNFDIWAVSGSNKWSVEPVFAHFGFPPERIIGIELGVEGGVLTGETSGAIPIREGKIDALRARTHAVPLLVASDSKNDIPLLSLFRGAQGSGQLPETRHGGVLQERAHHGRQLVGPRGITPRHGVSMPDAALTVIGGGAVGLAIAAELAARHAPLYLIERNPKYGQETSSRNSEVIHAGIYYATGSLKARLCVEGNRILYELCARHRIPHKRITKIITATRPEEEAELARLHALGTSNGVELRMMTRRRSSHSSRRSSPSAASFPPIPGSSARTGSWITISRRQRRTGREVQTHCTVVGLERRSADYVLTVEEAGVRSTFTSERVINAAGLESDTIASLAGIDVDAEGYRLHYSRGCYFSLPASLSTCVSRLVYPVPTHETLGVHAVLDLGGRLKFGPDIEYQDGRALDYRVDESKRSGVRCLRPPHTPPRPGRRPHARHERHTAQAAGPRGTGERLSDQGREPARAPGTHQPRRH